MHPQQFVDGPKKEGNRKNQRVTKLNTDILEGIANENVESLLMNSNNNEKEKLLLLQNIDMSKTSLSFEKSLSVLGLCKQYNIIRRFLNLYKEKQQIPEFDYEYVFKQKDMEIKKKKQ